MNNSIPKPEFLTLQDFMDPKLYEILNDPSLYEFTNKTMTVVFWDITGFSYICNTFKKQTRGVVGFLNKYCQNAIEIVNKKSGIIDKFIGDGILAYFGFNNNKEDAKVGTYNAINAAIELRQTFQIVKNEWIKIWREHFNQEINLINLKCGIHTGDVLFGILAMGTRFQVTVYGSTVNLASRLEGLADNQQIIISKDVKEIVEKYYQINYIPISSDNKIKSYPEIKQVYEIVE